MRWSRCESWPTAFLLITCKYWREQGNQTGFQSSTYQLSVLSWRTLACVYATSFKANKKVAYQNIVSTVEQTFIDEEISIN